MRGGGGGGGRGDGISEEQRHKNRKKSKASGGQEEIVGETDKHGKKEKGERNRLTHRQMMEERGGTEEGETDIDIVTQMKKRNLETDIEIARQIKKGKEETYMEIESWRKGRDRQIVRQTGKR